MRTCRHASSAPTRPPDHTTIARFRARHQDALARTFTQVLALCARAGLVSVGVVALIEYDRTNRATKLIGKLARYDHFLTDGWRRTRYARHPDDPAVLFITRTDAHLPNALREADRQLTAHAGPNSDSTRTRYPGREELAFTSRRRLLDGDDTILQTTRHASRQARSIQITTPTLQARLPLSTLFG
jgi:hypothetical protein